MDIPLEWIYLFVGLLIGLVLASGHSHERNVAACCPYPGMIVVVDSNGNTFVSSDNGNSWSINGKLPR